MMALLDGLKLSNVEKPNFRDPIVIRRSKMIKKLDEQIELLTNPTSPNSITVDKKVCDDQTGELSVIKVEKRVIPWWWSNKEGKIFLSVKYGTRVVELKKGKPAIQIDSMESLPEILGTIRKAVELGELDNHLATAGFDLRKRFSL